MAKTFFVLHIHAWTFDKLSLRQVILLHQALFSDYHILLEITSTVYRVSWLFRIEELVLVSGRTLYKGSTWNPFYLKPNIKGYL